MRRFWVLYQTEFKYRFKHLLTVWPWANSLNSLSKERQDSVIKAVCSFISHCQVKGINCFQEIHVCQKSYFHLFKSNQSCTSDFHLAQQSPKPGVTQRPQGSCAEWKKQKRLLKWYAHWPPKLPLSTEGRSVLCGPLVDLQPSPRWPATSREQGAGVRKGVGVSCTPVLPVCPSSGPEVPFPLLPLTAAAQGSVCSISAAIRTTSTHASEKPARKGLWS